jgi:hypothetical protein
VCKCRDNVWGNDFCRNCQNSWTRSFSAKAVAAHAGLPAATPVKKDGTAWETPIKPAKVIPARATGRQPKITGPKHFRLSQSEEEDNEGGEDGEADSVQANIDNCVQQVERLKALQAHLGSGHYKPDNPFVQSTSQELAEWEGQLLTLRGVKRDELPYEARTARLTRQIKEVQGKSTRSKALREEAKAEVLAAQAKAAQMQEQYLRQKQKGKRLQEELDEVSKKRPPVFLDSRSEEDSSGSDGFGSSAPAPRSKAPAQRSTPIPPPSAATGPEGTPAPAPVGTGPLVQIEGAPSGSGGPLVLAAPGQQSRLGTLMAAGRKRRNTGGQKGKAQAKSQKEGSECMSDVLADDDSQSNA